MSELESESQLIREAISGDRGSLSQLLLLHYDALYWHVESRISTNLRGLMRADDVLQQTFVRAAQAISTFELRQGDGFRCWLKTIADNLVRDAEKRRRRERRESPGANSPCVPDINRVTGGQTSPSRRVQRGESIHVMKRALARLPGDQQEVLRRRYLQGQSLDQIAAAMQRSKDAVRGLCFRARKNLRAGMGHSSLYFSN
jgi:RNA polymerase sigma-70 factor (ECF subfamily)